MGLIKFLNEVDESVFVAEEESIQPHKGHNLLVSLKVGEVKKMVESLREAYEIMNHIVNCRASFCDCRQDLKIWMEKWDEEFESE